MKIFVGAHIISSIIIFGHQILPGMLEYEFLREKHCVFLMWIFGAKLMFFNVPFKSSQCVIWNDKRMKSLSLAKSLFWNRLATFEIALSILFLFEWAFSILRALRKQNIFIMYCRALPSPEGEGSLPEILSGLKGPKRGFGNSFQPAIDAPRYNLTSCVIAPSAKMPPPTPLPPLLIQSSLPAASLHWRGGTN